MQQALLPRTVRCTKTCLDTQLFNRRADLTAQYPKKLLSDMKIYSHMWNRLTSCEYVATSPTSCGLRHPGARTCDKEGMLAP